jgi:hypothetical protein
MNIGGDEMGSVSSTNPGVANLLQMLQNGGSPVLASSRVTDALQNAPANDVVQLSMSAIQSQNMGALFGVTGGATTNGAALENLLTGATANANPTGNTTGNGVLSTAELAAAAPADQTAYYQSAAQASQTEGMMNAGIFSNKSGSLINIVG